MENYNVDNAYADKGSVAKGLVGALLGAIIGALAWGVVGVLTQRVFSLLGIAIGFLVGKGYELLKGREGAMKIVIIILCTVLAVVLGETIYNVAMFHQTYMDTAAEIGAEARIDLVSLLKTNPDAAYLYIVPEMEALQMTVNDPDFRSDALANLGQALLFAAVGASAVIVNFGKSKQAAPAPAAAAPAEPSDPSDAA